MYEEVGCFSHWLCCQLPSVYCTNNQIVISRLEHRLRLPKSNSSVADTTVGSTVFFTDLQFERYSLLVPDLQRALSCTAKVPTGLQILHWVTEYRTANVPDDQVLRQTVMAMVPGLYQRRALGFPDHFVFGSAHLSTCLRVFAGTWVLKSGPLPTAESGDDQQQPGVDEMPDVVQGVTTSEKVRLAEDGEPLNKRRKLSDSARLKVAQEPTTDRDRYEASLSSLALLSVLTSQSCRSESMSSVNSLSLHLPKRSSCIRSCTHLGTSPSNMPPTTFHATRSNVSSRAKWKTGPPLRPPGPLLRLVRAKPTVLGWTPTMRLNRGRPVPRRC
jgi:hypothetical protein